MTYINAASLGTVPGRRDDLVAQLTTRSDRLLDLGCSAYEVGVSEDRPDEVFVVETWTDRAAHRASLDDADVRASIAAARPLLNGESGGFGFDVEGSPLRD